MKASIILFLMLSCLPLQVFAADAAMSFSSANAVYAAGSKFTSRLVINSGGGKGINAAQGKILYNPNQVLVEKITKTGSIFDLWPKEPKFDNKKGEIEFVGGSTKSFRDSAGLLFTISFKPVARGEIALTIASTSSFVTTADGSGDDILKDIDNASYSLASYAAVNEAEALRTKMNGRILLQVENSGRSWYVYPVDRRRYYLGRPVDAFNLMRKLGLGVSHDYVAKYVNGTFPKKMAGRIILDVGDGGKAYYVNPLDNKGYYLGKPNDAFQVMRKLGLGISNSAIKKIPDWSI